jgi:hypothetical protein
MSDEEKESKFRATTAAEEHAGQRDAKDQRSDVLTARLLDMVVGLQKDVMDNMRKEGAAVQELKEGLARVEKRVEDFVSAFPEGDAVQHRKVHEGQIEAAKKKELFWEKMKFTFWALVLSSMTLWLAVAAWRAFLMGPLK